jgi:hypothetical protein
MRVKFVGNPGYDSELNDAFEHGGKRYSSGPIDLRGLPVFEREFPGTVKFVGGPKEGTYFIKKGVRGLSKKDFENFLRSTPQVDEKYGTEDPILRRLWELAEEGED